MVNPEDLHRCPDCGDYLRPSVVWFGEALPEDELMRAADAVQNTDLMLVVGTSAAVMPAARLIDIARENGADIIIVNTEQTATAADSDIELIGKAGDLIVKLFS